MANVSIYEEHREILDALISSGKVASVPGNTDTGPFRDQRDAYVFAVSVAVARNKPTFIDDMPKSRKGTTTIRDTVFLGADGAKELAVAVALVADSDKVTTREMLSHQLDLLADEKLDERLALLDRYAHSGFSWLAARKIDESNVRDLILGAIEEVEVYKSEVNDGAAIQDPLTVLLDMSSVQL